ncbi:MAG: hemolysin family protein [Actinobacteria bacterium]|nr:hemolysin family protein [Actinomycetota bacterium]
MMVVWGYVAVVLLVALTAFLGASETVLTRMGVVRALRLQEDDRRGAGALLWLLEHPARALNVILLLTLATRIAAAGLLTLLVLGAGGWAVSIGLLVLAVASFVLAEVAPRTFTLHHLERVGLLIAPLVAALTRALQPLARVLVSGGSALVARARSGPFTSDEELRRLLSQEHEDAGIEDDERAMIHSIFELGDTVCREIMVPRPDMTTVSVDDDLDDVVRVIIDRGYSRIPVWRDSRDDIVGIVYAKDVLQRLAAGGSGWSDLTREPTFVPETKRADELLRDLQRRKVHLALVVDEHGAVDGLVTIEDILEEIVGEIIDEYDREEPPVVRLGDARLRVSARLTVHDLNELLEADLPEDEGWDTVGGLVIGLLGRVPDPGEAVSAAGLTFVAERVQGRRVSKVLVTRPRPDEAEEPVAR